MADDVQPTCVRLSVADEVVDRHPGILVGGMLVANLRAAADGLAERMEPDIRQELVDRGLHLETLADEPIIAGWRAAIAACGLKPSSYRSSPEQLARRTLKSGPVRTGLRLVDVYCDISTRHLAPLGGYDATCMPEPSVEVRMANPETDQFAPLGEDGDMPLSADVVVYASGTTIMCWAFNCRDSRSCRLTEDTDVGLFLGEAVTEPQHGPLRAALTELAGVLQRAGAAVGPIAYADPTRTVAELLPEPNLEPAPEP
jgi:DNA/RNA-binding domain of Phe-tRNA-synthetase-like protein